jgi:hypothetical protein
METVPDFVQTCTLIQPVRNKSVLADPPPRLRFHKKGPKATAAATERMRAIKETLRLTTRQLVVALNDYERKFHPELLRDASGSTPGGMAWQPMTTVVLSSYLQGFVQQDHYINHVLMRLENYHRHARQHLDPGQLAEKDIRALMDGWFERLRIQSKDKFRPFAKLIAPYHRRPIQAKLAGKISFGAQEGPIRRFLITEVTAGTAEPVSVVHGAVDRIHELLVQDGQLVALGQEIQYGIQYQTAKDPTTKSPLSGANGPVYLDLPIEDHTAFFRWYKSGSGPRSIKTLEYVQQAVDQAAANLPEL